MLNSLQIARGLAAWSVVFHHIVKSYFMGVQPNAFWAFASKYGSSGVDIFFVLSGVVMAMISKKYERNGKDFLVNRAFRVLPNYWFYTTLLVLSITMLPKGSYVTWWEGSSLIQSLLLIPNPNPNGYGLVPTLYVGWTLTYELFFYLVFSIILLLKIPKPAITCALTLVLLAFALRNHNFLGQSSFLLVEFSAGISVFLIYEAIASKDNAKIIKVLSGMLPAFLFIVLTIQGSLVVRTIAATCIIATFISLESMFSKNIKMLSFFKRLGDYSYSTYLCHVIIIGWFYAVFNPFNFRNNPLIILAILLSVYFVSLISYRYVENNISLMSIKRKLLK